METGQVDIAIIGAGPAGAHLASRLAAEGRDVVLFDPKGAWEKPCGGGVPTRAIREFAFLLESSNYPCKLVRQITMISPLERRVTLTLDEPFAVYSRQVLNGLVLDRAIDAGTRFVRDSVSDFTRERDGWLITTNQGERWRANFLVGADGAASFTRRRLIGIFPKQDLALAFGYNIECVDESPASNGNGSQRGGPNMDEVVVRFPRGLTGYLWAFPRPGGMNFGIFSKLDGARSDKLRHMLADFVRGQYDQSMPSLTRSGFFGSKIPMLHFTSWENLRASGEAWALIGDAAGFADPITGEGIYYAFKSAELLADALHHHRMAGTYESLWRTVFGRELEQASFRVPQFYGYSLGHVFTDSMILLSRYHRGIRTILGKALIGDQSYISLRKDIVRRVLRVF